MRRTAALSLSAARDALLQLPHPFTRDAVHGVVECLAPDADELTPYLNFSEEEYTRTLFYRGPRFEMLVLCWRDGQASPIHDHAASLCSMAVVRGRCHAENFRIADGRAACSVSPGDRVPLERTSTESCAEGRVVTVAGGDIHRVGNGQGNGVNLVTVHFYLPPIISMRTFDEDTGRCRILQAKTLQPRL